MPTPITRSPARPASSVSAPSKSSGAQLDDRRRMDPNRLDRDAGRLRPRGVPIVAVSAAACATPIGAFDRLEDMAEVCRRHEVWLHVDAAHGGAACFSPRHRHLLAGIEQADSVVCDAHKMMFVPALCALVFYRNPATPLRHISPGRAVPVRSVDTGTGELRQRPAEPGVHEAGRGVRPVGHLVAVWRAVVCRPGRRHIRPGRRFYEMLRAADDFEPLHEPQCNIVAFRYLPRRAPHAPPERVDAFQLHAAPCRDRVGPSSTWCKPSSTAAACCA